MESHFYDVLKKTACDFVEFWIFNDFSRFTTLRKVSLARQDACAWRAAG